MSRIGDAIRQAQRKHGMTAAALAEQVTLTPQYIRLINCGGAIPSRETVVQIANVFPDEDSTAWLWLLLRDLWGDPIADVMRRHPQAQRFAAECWPPGCFIDEEATMRGWAWFTVTQRLGWSAWEMLDVVTGRQPITPARADDLARVFATSSEYWLNLQARWDAYRASDNTDDPA